MKMFDLGGEKGIWSVHGKVCILNGSERLKN